MAVIPLRDVTGAAVAEAIVDDEDADRLNQYSWSLTTTGYARRGRSRGRGRVQTMLMHREIAGSTLGDRLTVAHVNGNRLDNRKANLRVVPTVLANRPTHATSPDASRERATVEVP